MHKPFFTGFCLAIVWLILRYTIGLYMPPETAFKIGVFINIFFVLTSIFVVFFFDKKKNQYLTSLAMQDFKLAIKGGIVYVVLVSFSIFIFYKYIDSSLFDYKREKIKNEIYKLSKEEIINRKNKNQATKDLTIQEFINKINESNEAMANPKTQSILSALGLTIWCIIASIFSTIIFRKILFVPRK